MKIFIHFLLITLLFSLFSCEKVAEDAVKLTVDYSWKGIESCGWGNPEISIKGIPQKTKNLKIHMYDHKYKYNHGTVVFPYYGDNLITQGRFQEIEGPCPPNNPGEYEITIKALDENGIVIGIGEKTRFFPEKK